jgi:crossover junction endodeoxyribonuclease RusA
VADDEQPVDGFTMRVECVPVAKERPRLTRYGGVYTPARTVEFERLIGQSWREQQGETLIETPVVVWINVGVVNMKKDIDNLVKSICDGLNGVAWLDDKQVVELHAWKYPAVKGHEFVNVVVRRVEDEH